MNRPLGQKSRAQQLGKSEMESIHGSYFYQTKILQVEVFLRIFAENKQPNHNAYDKINSLSDI
ncbi:MAG: hypothetical protein E7149_03935 [Rikenellaceae bacterium]|nr:hypothetical protein [Rikenellaceae bacterium]